MKKVLRAAAVLAAMSMMSVSAFADVYVTIADKDGKLAVTQESVELSDKDGDGSLTVNDALIAAHDKFYDGGAEAGYASLEGDYGLMLTKLWGEENGGSYGYYVNTNSAMSLADTLKDNDCVSAFVYTDLTGFSDTFCFFDEALDNGGDVRLISAAPGSDVEYTLMAATFDENWSPITVPVVGAEMTINGEKTGIKTDDNGKAAITVPSEAGTYIVSAVSDTQTLVPPVAKLIAETSGAESNDTAAEDEAVTAGDVEAAADSSKGSPDTGIEDAAAVMGLAIIAAGTIAIIRKRK